jgi:hypothetical protein
MPKRKRARTKRVSAFKIFLLLITISLFVLTLYSRYFSTVPEKVSIISEEHPKVKQHFHYIYFGTEPINAGEYVNGTIIFYNIERRYLPMLYIIAEGKLSTVNAQNPTPINPDYNSEGKPYNYSPESKTFEINFSFKANSSTIYLFLIPQEFSSFKVSAYVVRNMPNKKAEIAFLILTIFSAISTILKLKPGIKKHRSQSS